MFRIFIGRFICIVSVFLMVSGFTFSMNTLKVERLNFTKTKKLTFSVGNEIESLSFSEIEDFEENDEKEIFDSYDYFKFHNRFHLNEINDDFLFYSTFKYNCKKSIHKLPIWLSLYKIII
jgi:hypothetical protein